MATVRKLFSVLPMALSIAAPVAVWAQTSPATQNSASASSDVLEEVVVTAEKRSQDLQKTAVSVTAVSGDQLEATSITNYIDALQNVPGILAQGANNPGTGTPSFIIRGLGTNGNPNPSVTTYLDGVILGGQTADFYDIARVEVLRGPQGTLYGGNAPAGSVNIVTNDPSLAGFTAAGQVGIGNYSTIDSNAVLNLPVGDTVAIRAAFNENKRDNYYPGGDANSETNGRLKVLFKPNDELSLLVGAEFSSSHGAQTDGVRQQNANGDFVGPYIGGLGYGATDTEKFYANLNWNIGIGTLTYLPAYQHLISDDFTADPIQAGSTSRGVVPFNDTLTNELRLANNEGSPITWVVGVYDKKVDFDQHVFVQGPALVYPPFVPFLEVSSGLHTRGNAFFGQATVPIAANIRFTGGLRYSIDSITNPQSLMFFIPVPPSFIPYEQRFTHTDELARFEADITPMNMVYASYATGYRPGGAGASGANYQTENDKSYEIGSKNRFLNDKIQLNVAVYYTDIDALQLQTVAPIPGGGGLVQATVASVPTKLYGAELEAAAQVTAEDQITATAAYDHGRFGSGDLPASGGTPPNNPKWLLSARIDHKFNFSNGTQLIASADAHYQSEQLVTYADCAYQASLCSAAPPPLPTPNAAYYTQSAYTLVDASLGYHWKADAYSVTLYGRNLGDTVYKTGAGLNYAGWAFPGAPRTYGVTVAAKL